LWLLKLRKYTLKMALGEKVSTRGRVSRSIAGSSLILLSGALLSKIIGFLAWIPLARLMGTEGVGLYQRAYPIYGLMLVVSASGMPVAISKLVAERMATGDASGAKQVFRVAFGILVFSGLLLTLVIYSTGKFLAVRVLGDPRLYYSLLALAPALTLVCAMAAFRGYFQGLQKMLPTALSQVSEQIVRVVTMLFLAYLLFPYGVEYAAAGATFGAVTGAVIGLILLIALYRKKENLEKTSPAILPSQVTTRNTLSALWAIALPVTLGALVMPVTETINAVLVPARLQFAGFTVPQATSYYGQLVGMGMSLVSLPTIATVAIGTTLVPFFSGEQAASKYSDTIGGYARETIRLAILIGLPSSLVLFMLPGQITRMLFNAPEAGAPLAVLAISSLFLCLQNTTTGILQGMGKPQIPVRGLVYGGLANIFLNYYLTSFSTLGIKGAAFGMVTGFALAAWINLREIVLQIGFSLNWINMIVKPVLAVTFMAISIRTTYQLLSFYLHNDSLATVSAITGGLIFYLVALYASGQLPKIRVQEIF
jgi:stage V sporulation protein B